MNFGQLRIEDITKNVRLINCFNNSGCQSIDDFIKLGELNRMKIRSYGKSTEIALQLAMKNFDIQKEQINLQNKKLAANEEMLNQIKMHEITRNVRLIHAFENSSCQSVLEFLNLGTIGRMNIKAYGVSTENDFRKCLEDLKFKIDELSNEKTHSFEYNILKNKSYLTENSIKILKNTDINSFNTTKITRNLFLKFGCNTWWDFISNSSNILKLSALANAKLNIQLTSYLLTKTNSVFIKNENESIIQQLKDYFSNKNQLKVSDENEMLILNTFSNFDFNAFCSAFNLIENHSFMSKSDLLNQMSIENATKAEVDIFMKTFSLIGNQIFLPNIAQNFLPSWVIDYSICEFIEDARINSFAKQQNILQINEIISYTQNQRVNFPNWGLSTEKKLYEWLIKLATQQPLYYKNNINNELLKLTIEKSLSQHFNDYLSIKKPIFKQVGELRVIKALTLEEAGNIIGITRERVRQIEKALINEINNSYTWWHYISFTLNKLLSTNSKPITIIDILNVLNWAKIEDNDIIIIKTILLNKIDKLKILTIENTEYLSSIDNTQWQELQSSIFNQLEQFIESQITYDEVEDLINANIKLISNFGLQNLLSHQIKCQLNYNLVNSELLLISIGSSLKVKIYNILYKSLVPLHFSFITSLFKLEYDPNISEKNIHTCLNIYDEFKLFDRGVYGISKHFHMNSDEIELITNFCTENIFKLDTGKQWHSEEIIQKLSHLNLYNLNKYTLGIILHKCENIFYLGKFIWQFKNNTNQQSARIQTDELITKILIEAKRPITIQELEAKIQLEKGTNKFFQGSVRPNNVFSRVAPGLWGLINRDFELKKSEWEEQVCYLINTLLVKNKGIHFSELDNFILHKYRQKINSNLIWGIILQDERFKVFRGHFFGLINWASHNRENLDQTILEFVKGKKSFTFDEIKSYCETHVKYSFNT